MDIIIRPASPEDAHDLNELRRQPSVMENTLSLPSETEEYTRDFLLTAGPYTHLLVAEADDGAERRAVGLVALMLERSPRRRDTAEISLMVDERYQGQGIGRRLLESALEIADKWLMLHRVQLTVFAGNERAKKLYESCGFVAEGIQRGSTIRNGEYADEYMMGRVRHADS